MDEKKTKKPFSFKLTNPSSKSVIMAAISDRDLNAWYSIFNKYVKEALGESRLSSHSSGNSPVFLVTLRGIHL